MKKEDRSRKDTEEQYEGRKWRETLIKLFSDFSNLFRYWFGDLAPEEEIQVSGEIVSYQPVQAAFRAQVEKSLRRRREMNFSEFNGRSEQWENIKSQLNKAIDNIPAWYNIPAQKLISMLGSLATTVEQKTLFIPINLPGENLFITEVFEKLLKEIEQIVAEAETIMPRRKPYSPLDYTMAPNGKYVRLPYSEHPQSLD